MEDPISFLLSEYEELIDPKISYKFIEWLERCRSHNNDSKRLLFCLGIDTKFKLVDKGMYVNLFNHLDYDSPMEPQHKFHNIVTKEDAKFHFFSDQKESIITDQYCGLVKLSTFGKYFLRKKYYTKDELRYLKERIEDGDYLTVDLPCVSSEKPREVVWVTLLKEINILEKQARERKFNVTEYLCNKLGLDWDHMGTDEDPCPEWVKVTYPKEIKEVFYQPISTNANWRSLDGLYLSYKKLDSFGRTRSQIKVDSFKGVKERVHHKIETNYSYSIKYVGKAINCKKLTNTILSSAKYRFNEH